MTKSRSPDSGYVFEIWIRYSLMCCISCLYAVSRVKPCGPDLGISDWQRIDISSSSAHCNGGYLICEVVCWRCDCDVYRRSSSDTFVTVADTNGSVYSNDVSSAINCYVLTSCGGLSCYQSCHQQRMRTRLLSSFRLRFTDALMARLHWRRSRRWLFVDFDLEASVDET